mmetsp:Transcript_11824/g.15397  ORF Transcript_11824/g.15397 Transcript_11824/m.15397 type:complete len:152 (+) Transcript_11824:63-518(+)
MLCLRPWRVVANKKVPKYDRAAFSTSTESMLHGLSLKQVSQVFNGAFKPGVFPNHKIRQATLMEMRKAYCAKMLEECAISPQLLERLTDPTYLPTREEILTAFKLDLPSAYCAKAQHSRTLDNTQADVELIERILNTSPGKLVFTHAQIYN